MTNSPKSRRSPGRVLSRSRARVKCGVNGRVSWAKPNGTRSASMRCCKDTTFSTSPPTMAYDAGLAKIVKDIDKNIITILDDTHIAPVMPEKVLNQFIKIRQEEAAFIEKTKKDWLKDWKKISKPRIQQSMEKFAVIEGSKKIYSKIAEMIENTTIKLSAISTVKDLVRAEQFGVFDFAYKHPLKTEVQFRFLTEINNQNLKAIKLLKPN